MADGRLCTPARRNARRALAWAGGLFVGLHFALPALADFARPGWQSPELARKFDLLDAARRRGPGRPLLVALGSSRTLNGVRAELLDGVPLAEGPALAFNLGVTGGGPMRQLLAYDRLCDQGIRPGLVLIEVMPGLLNEPGRDRLSEEAWLDTRELSAGDVARLRAYHSRPDRLTREWLRHRLTPGGRGALVAAAAGDWARFVPPEMLPPDARGWQTFRSPLAHPDHRAALTRKSLGQFAAVLGDFRPAPGSTRAVYDLLARCRAESVPVVLVCLPESPSFRRAYGPALEAGLRRLLEGLTEAGAAGVIDARDWGPEEAFRDGHHLLPGAATVFTARLRDELMTIVQTPNVVAGFSLRGRFPPGTGAHP